MIVQVDESKCTKRNIFKSDNICIQLNIISCLFLKGSSHGVGVYFAVKALTSASGYCRADANGHKHIYMAHVLTGEYCVGRGGIRVPPLKPSSSETFDSTTDNVQSPNFFVIFHDAQAYPSYLITFR